MSDPLLARARSHPRRPRRAGRALEQLAIGFPAEPPRWSFSRLVLASPHQKRIRDRLDFVRGFFPELDGTTVRAGLARKRGVLGWGSLDPERPGIWVRPRRLDAFTIAHELTHLLQARGLVPRGERACDLWTLARSPLLVDASPGYLRLPAALRGQRQISPRDAALLHRTACLAIEARARGRRDYLKRFERDLEAAVRERPATRPREARAEPLVIATWDAREPARNPRRRPRRLT